MKKNIIIICIDGARNDRATKSLIFKNYLPGSVFFSQSITYAPYTNSALFAVFSGTYGNRNGCNSYYASFDFETKKFKTLTEYLLENNYHTYADVNSQIIIPKHGFEEFTVYDESEVDLSERHADLINHVKTRNDQGKNFFLYLHYESIHTGVLNSVLKGYTNFSKEYFENRKKNEERYDQLFSKSEIYLKKILDKIKESDLLKNTIILILSDHGISVGEKFGERAYGAFCYDYTIRTFASYISPELKNKEIPNQVRHIDFMPTILDILHIPLDPKYEKLDGISLLPLFNNQILNEKTAISQTGNPLKNKEPPENPNVHSIRTSNWKLIYNQHDGSKELYEKKVKKIKSLMPDACIGGDVIVGFPGESKSDFKETYKFLNNLSINYLVNISP